MSSRQSSRRAAQEAEDALDEEAVGIDDLAQRPGGGAGEDDGLGVDADPDDDEAAEHSGRNVRVVVRVRPLLSGECETHQSTLVRVDGERVRVHASDGADSRASAGSLSSGHISVAVKDQQHDFKFDAVLLPQHEQVDVYDAGKVERMIVALLKGYNSTIFAYGQTVSKRA
jgi:hypothetical protein